MEELPEGVRAESEQQAKSEALVMPDSSAIEAAWQYFVQNRRRRVYKTIRLKAHNPTAGKVKEILWAQVEVTNLTSNMLSLLGPATALECIEQMFILQDQGYKFERVEQLGEIIQSCFRKAHNRTASESHRRLKKVVLSISGSSKSDLVTYFIFLAAVLATPKHEPPVRISLPSSDAPPIPNTLKTGIARTCALMLLNWHTQIVKRMKSRESDRNQDEKEHQTETGKENNRRPSAKEIFEFWQHTSEIYHRAENHVVPFGRDRGKTLEEVGKRGARWLRERLIPEKAIDRTLVHIQVLLAIKARQTNSESEEPLDTVPFDEETQRRAQRARHPWRRKVALERTPRAGRVSGHDRQQGSARVTLKSLSTDELLRLENELLEYREYAEYFDQLRAAIEIFLNDKPPTYPIVATVKNDDQFNLSYEEYDRELSGYCNPYPRNRQKDVTTFSSQDLLDVETSRNHAMLKTASTTREPSLQSLSYVRAMRPIGPQQEEEEEEIDDSPSPAQTSQADDCNHELRARYPAFALLFRRHEYSYAELWRKYRRFPRSQRSVIVHRMMSRSPEYEFVLALVVHTSPAHREPYYRRKFQPDLEIGTYYFVDYPYTPFIPPRKSSVIILKLESGWKRYRHEADEQPFPEGHLQAERLLRSHIQTMEQAQQKRYEDFNEKRKTYVPIERCLPRKSSIGSAHIITRRNTKGKFEIYAHIPIPLTTPIPQKPDVIMGIHEHPQGYFYAIVTADGATIEVGDIPIPQHVMPDNDDLWMSENYVYEVVWSMIKLAKQYNAYLAIEDSLWKKDTVSLDHTLNRVLHARPTKKIIETLSEKALSAGLLRPLLVSDVSPVACGKCGIKAQSHVQPITTSLEAYCPKCQAIRIAFVPGNPDRLHCTECDFSWRSRGAIFECLECNHRTPTRYSQAELTARLAFGQLVQYHQNHRRIMEEKGDAANRPANDASIKTINMIDEATKID
jgi:hypothetical protein